MTAEVMFLPFIILLILLLVAIAILAFIFWIWTIIDCAKRNFKNETEKVVWILVIVLTGLIGSIIYYFVVMTSKKQGVKK